MNLVIFDYEVFRNDTLFGALIIHEDSLKLFQTWNLDENKNFYKEHENDIWIGHNNYSYDDIILNAVLKNKNIKEVSNEVIVNNKRFRSNVPKYSYDIMFHSRIPFSLKLSELLLGKNIHESEIDFESENLTNEQKLIVEKYNQDDLYQTYDNFKIMKDIFVLRLSIIKEFNLPLTSLRKSGTGIAALALNAHKIEGIENALVPPILPKNLELKNEELKQYFLNEDFRTNKKLKLNIGGVIHTIGQGGIHASVNKIYIPHVLYFDVSGYYNLTMINYNLLPRTLGESGKEKYNYMYHEQLKLKKINPFKRYVYKVILLSVFGAMLNEHTDFYDPQHGLLVTITGQMFLVDLLEKLVDYVNIIQSNTDGIIVEPKDWKDKDKIINIVENWEKRTGYTIKKEEKFDLYQRDVNCYIVLNSDKSITRCGDLTKVYDTSENSYANGILFTYKIPPIVAQGIINYLIYNITPEKTVADHKRELKLFQYIIRKQSFDWCELETIDENNNVTITKLQGINRGFAYNGKTQNTVYKRKFKGKTTKAKMGNLPTNVFIYNDEILSDEAINKVSKNIDYEYYVNDIYKHCADYFDID